VDRPLTLEPVRDAANSAAGGRCVSFDSPKMLRLIPMQHAAGLAAVLFLAVGCADDSAGPLHPAALPPPTRDLPARIDVSRFVDSLKTFMPGRDTNGYSPPLAAERDEFLQIFEDAVRGDMRRADSLAQTFRYDIEESIDDVTGDILALVVERAPIERGWGTFVLRRDGTTADIHDNHPLFDINTPLVAATLFTECRCRAWLMAGTHRYANGGDASDMARSTASIFEGVHERLSVDGGIAVSVHGFTGSNYDGPTAGSDAVLSSGDTDTGELARPASAIALRDALRQGGFIAGHVAVDAGYDFLTATSNPQGRYSNLQFGAGRWIHVEIERHIRDDETLWRPFVSIISSWLSATVDAGV